MADDTMLGLEARQRMAALLPQLLGAVRARRRRRQVRRAATVLLFACVPLAAWWASHGAPVRSALTPAPVAVSAPAAVPDSAIVTTDPRILARCAVATVERAEWYVDDDYLQAVLRAEAREAGLVRVGGRVLVSASAIDPWPEAP